nr:RecName: Full=Cationic protein C1 [Bunodosoma caissarum]
GLRDFNVAVRASNGKYWTRRPESGTLV